MKKKIVKITMVILFITIIFINSISASAVFSINSADLYSKGKCKSLLKMKSNGGEITVTKVFYRSNGKENPAYCVNVELGGVGEYGPYSVTVDNAINNPAVWRAITNGYPYKSLEQLGLQDEDEAYTATKQAVYCVLYGYDTSRYEPIGEAGTRTLNALKQIVKIARENTNSKPSNKIEIQEIENWEIDENDKNYISKKLKIVTECNSREFEINFLKDEVKSDKESTSQDIKICDLKGNIIQKTKEKEFKIMIPIVMLEKDGTIDINVKSELETNPVLYGKSNNSSKQNYALAGEKYELGEGNIKIKYTKNTNKLVITKTGGEEEKPLNNVEFRILNEKGEEKYSNLVTDKNGKIVLEGLLPGKYFLEETKTIDGYKKLENNLEFDIDLNEELSINISNEKQDKIENKTIYKNEKKYKQETIDKAPENNTVYEKTLTKLPVTGM